MPLTKLVPHWQRRLDGSDRPAYLLIADLIAEDLRSGRLTARERLPTLRELADSLKLNYTPWHGPTPKRARCGMRRVRRLRRR